MRALVLAGPGRVEVRDDVPDPAIEAPGDAIVRVRLAGVCGSDLHPYEGREAVARGIVPGHEAAGEVVEVGPAVGHRRPGDQVFLPFSTSCGRCEPCRRGLSARCEAGRLFGWAPPGDPDAGLSGTQAEYVRVPHADATLVELPPGRTAVEGVLLGDNFTTGYWAATRALGDATAGVPVGVVLGCGAVGLSAVATLRHLNDSPVLAVDPVEARRTAALRVGAAAAADPDGAEEALADLGGSAGAACVVEAVGSRAARQLAVRLAAPGATVSSVGVATDEFGVRPSDLYDRNLTWRAGRCPVRSLMSRVLGELEAGLEIPVAVLAPGPPEPLAEGPLVYRRFAAREGSGGKPLLAP